jgi:histidinol-phosphate aminotransferase
MTTLATTQTTDETRFQPAKRVSGVRPYRAPERDDRIDLRLDSNEGPRGSRRVLEATRIDAETLRRYPDASALERRIAARWKIDPARVVVTAGGDDAIDRVCRATLEPSRELATHAPSFEMIARSASLAGARVRAAPWLRGAFPEADLVGLMSERTGLVALVTPNNPTGSEIPPAAVRRIADAAAKRGAMTLLDAAYGEFAAADAGEAILDHPSVFIVRTFSKAFGLASLRVGCAIAPDARAAQWLRAAGGPYPVSAVALAAAEAALEDDALAETERFVSRIRTERRALTEVIRQLGGQPLESGANFIAAFVDDAALARDALASLGISVRAFTDGPMDGALRITLPGAEPEFERLRGALRSAISPEAVLFDMDGVLADVTGSYRAAIVETARSFGADVAPEDVAQVKNQGDANNDWIVTQRLIEAARGSAPTLEEVTDRFQSMYLGDDGRGGLRERERLLVSPEALRDLAKRKKMAIVTGRPRAEATWFLDRFGLEDLFPVVVAQEDAPAKPSPAGLRLAMERLDARSAWMIGDTVDDASAARAAGAVAMGVGDDEASRAAQGSAGCARVTTSVEQILEVLR